MKQFDCGAAAAVGGNDDVYVCWAAVGEMVILLRRFVVFQERSATLEDGMGPHIGL